MLFYFYIRLTMDNSSRLTAIFLMCLQVVHVLAFPGGAPWDTCLTMFPKHNGQQMQKTTCPFELTLNQTKYSPGDVIQLTLGSSSTEHTMKGLQIRARPREGDTEKIVGHFTSWPINKTQALSCLGGKQNMVTHRNNVPVASVQLYWQAPNISVGDVVFVVTFVQEFSSFWVDEEFVLMGTENITVPPVEQLSSKFEVIDWADCGTGKGCFMYPRTCTGYNCYAAVTYKTNNQSVEFEMFASQSGYVALGFSDDKLMGHDDTITCTADDIKIALQRGYNHEELYNERQYKTGIYNMQGTYNDGRLYCRFTRPLSMSLYIGEGHAQEKTYDLSNMYYVMLAWGHIYEGTEVMGIHKELPPISYSRVNFQQSEIVRGSSLPILKQLHGMFMLVSWMLLVGMATIIARHLKNGFEGKMACGAKIWFQIHRALAVMTWVLTAASFILIFVVVGGLTEKAQIHSYLGITVMSASTLQVLAGILRPDKDAKIRSLFNYGHWFLGKSTHILAGIAFYYAFNNEMVPQPQTQFANIVLGVWLGQQVFWEIWFEINKRCMAKKISENYELKPVSSKISEVESNPGTPDANSRLNRSLYMYIFSVTATVSAAVAAIFIF